MPNPCACAPCGPRARSLRANFRASLVGVSIAALALPLLAAGCRTPDTGIPGFASDVTEVQLLNTQVGGKNVYLPSTIVLTAGSNRRLSIFNTADVPHGFSIAGLGVQEVLPSKQEFVIELPELEGGNVYRIHCQLHPPHRTGTLVVLPAR